MPGSSRFAHAATALLVLAVGSPCTAWRAAAADASMAEDLAHFEKEVRPLLVKHCHECHSAGAPEIRSGLRLDSRAAILAGGDSGEIVAVGRPDRSRLVEVLRSRDPDVQMPPKSHGGPLPDDAVDAIAEWIRRGLSMPEGPVPDEADRVDARDTHWAFQPVHDHTPPAVAHGSWPQTDVDRFLLAKLEAAGLEPVADASPASLLRRLHLDLTGLPPEPAEVAEFVADPSSGRFLAAVDRLLASPRFGERWGRHWLDAVRFAESGGYEFDGFRPGAYHYRDWVIRALNADLPFDQFVKMQLAGDVLQPGYQGASATGFLMAGPFPGQITAKTEERIRYDQLDDIMMTVGGSMLGLTLGCVRCHEHKYDPFPHNDYYGMVASFARATHGSQFLDPDPAATQRAIEQHAADLVKLQQERAAYAHTTLPARFQEWQQKQLPQLTGEPRWQVGVPQSVETTDTWLATEADGVIRFTGPNRRNADTYSVTVFTHQKNLTSLRLDALTDKSLPNKGPGLGGDGSFTLADFKVTAKPLDPASTEAPVVLKLKPAQFAFEEQAHPFKNAIDDNPGTFWRAIGDNGKDNAG
ncbi:MAG: DUF1549 domain-containing protein, partial [Planctomycetaceae bacterium]